MDRVSKFKQHIFTIDNNEHWEFFQVENFSGEVFQVDTKDMKKKLMSKWGIF